jgi:hypothetical protein
MQGCAENGGGRRQCESCEEGRLRMNRDQPQHQVEIAYDPIFL